MATFDASSASVSLIYNGTNFIPSGLVGDLQSTPIHTSTHSRLFYSNGWTSDLEGTGFVYAPPPPNGLYEGITSGVFTDLTFSLNSNVVISITGLNANVADYKAIDLLLAETNSYIDDTPFNSITLADPDTITLGSGNDRFAGFGGDDNINGGEGNDTAVYFQNKIAYSVSKTTNGWVVSGDSDGADTLTNIERLQFADKNIALDASSTGNAGQAMEFIGIIAPPLLDSAPIRGLIISLFDQGNTMEGLCQLALDIGLAPKASNADLANAVFSNVTGGAIASQDMTNALVGYIEDHSQANFLATVAGMHINVDLVGLQQTGIEYTL